MKKQPTLVFCVIMDLIGMGTYAIPVIGELADIVWAPVSALIFYRTFGGKKGAIGGVLNFIEELIPGTDLIPSFTITWIYNYFTMKKVSFPQGKSSQRLVGSR